MKSYDHRQNMTPCKWRGCNVHLALMGDYCVTHWYKANGKELPDNGPAKPRAPRPNIDRNTVITGRRDTSRGAAAHVLPSTGTKRRTVYDAIMANMANGLTCDEVCEATGMLVQSATSAIHTLARDGWLTDSGERRPTRTGVLAIVWVAI
jgi:hypothetical protein